MNFCKFQGSTTLWKDFQLKHQIKMKKPSFAFLNKPATNYPWGSSCQNYGITKLPKIFLTRQLKVRWKGSGLNIGKICT